MAILSAGAEILRTVRTIGDTRAWFCHNSRNLTTLTTVTWSGTDDSKRGRRTLTKAHCQTTVYCRRLRHGSFDRYRKRYEVVQLVDGWFLR